jgi:DNA-binding transcriptional MerR regulator
MARSSVRSRSNWLKTSEVAEAVGISTRTLLRKLEAGLLPEPQRDPKNNYRLWSAQDVAIITQILRERP